MTRAWQWRHNEPSGVLNHPPCDCLLNRLFRRRSKKTSKLRVTGLCAGNSPVTGEFLAQRASNAENLMTSSWNVVTLTELSSLAALIPVVADMTNFSFSVRLNQRQGNSLNNCVTRVQCFKQINYTNWKSISKETIFNFQWLFCEMEITFVV